MCDWVDDLCLLLQPRHWVWKEKSVPQIQRLPTRISMDDSYSGGIFTYGGDSVTTKDKDIIYTYLALLLISIANITIIYHVISGDTNIYWNISIIIIFTRARTIVIISDIFYNITIKTNLNIGIFYVISSYDGYSMVYNY